MRKCDLLLLQVFTILFFQLSNSCVISHVCVCVLVHVVYYNKLIQKKSSFIFMCVPVCMCTCVQVLMETTDIGSLEMKFHVAMSPR